MKTLLTLTCCAMLSFLAVSSNAQNNRAVKTPVFAALPSTIVCKENQLIQLFANEKKQAVNIQFSNELTLTGTVISKEVKYSNLETMIIQLPAYHDMLFSLSKQTDKNNKITFVGRMLNPLYPDGFELKRNAAGNYQLNKINTEHIIITCNR